MGAGRGKTRRALGKTTVLRGAVHDLVVTTGDLLTSIDEYEIGHEDDSVYYALGLKLQKAEEELESARNAVDDTNTEEWSASSKALLKSTSKFLFYKSTLRNAANPDAREDKLGSLEWGKSLIIDMRRAYERAAGEGREALVAEDVKRVIF